MQYVIRTKNEIIERRTESEKNLSELLINLCREFGHYEPADEGTSLYISLDPQCLNAPGYLQQYSNYDIFLVTYTDQHISESIRVNGHLTIDTRPIGIFITIDDQDEIKEFIVDYVNSVSLFDSWANNLPFPQEMFGS